MRRREFIKLATGLTVITKHSLARFRVRATGNSVLSHFCPVLLVGEQYAQNQAGCLSGLGSPSDRRGGVSETGIIEENQRRPFNGEEENTGQKRLLG